MKIVAMMRVRNEARWLREVLQSIQQVTHEILVFDDHSTDSTPAIARHLGCTVIHSPFDDSLDETRDKNHLLAAVRERDPHYVLSIDGDEVLERGAGDRVRKMLHPGFSLYCFPIKYLWNDRGHYRADGVYGKYQQWRAFSLVNQSNSLQFKSTKAGGNFHCGNTPFGLKGAGCLVQCDVLHLGYIDAELRIKKYRWYNEKDPDNASEDCYRHVAQGDLPELPADEKFRHGGPLKLFTLPASKWPIAGSKVADI